jgi:hypothetical protein
VKSEASLYALYKVQILSNFSNILHACAIWQGQEAYQFWHRSKIQDVRHGRFRMLYPLRIVNLLISHKISLLQFPNALMTYRKSYMTIKLVTSNLTFDLKWGHNG